MNNQTFNVKQHNVLAVKKQKGKKNFYSVWIRNSDPLGEAKRYVVNTKAHDTHGFHMVSSHQFDGPDFRRIRKSIHDQVFFDKRTKKRRRIVGQYLFNKRGIICLVVRGPDKKLKNLPLHAYKHEIELGEVSDGNPFAGVDTDQIDDLISQISSGLRSL